VPEGGPRSQLGVRTAPRPPAPTSKPTTTVRLSASYYKETDTTFAIGWKLRYRIEGPAFVYADNDSGRVTTLLGYPTDQLAQIG